MLRACGKRLIAAMAGVALMGLAAGPAAAQQAAFARIAVSEKSVVYLRIQGGELRAAMSAEGLQTAAPIEMSHPGSTSMIPFPEFTLPVPADQLPAGVAPIQARLMWTRFWTGGSALPTPHFYGRLTVRRTDDRKAEWQYVSQVNVEAGTSAEKAPTIKLATMEHAKAVLQATPSKGMLAIGLDLTDGDAPLSGVLKDGEPVEVTVAVTDASGAEIASKVGPLSDFGFS